MRINNTQIDYAKDLGAVMPIYNLTLFRKGGRGRGGKKATPTSFSPVTSINIALSPQNFSTFSFNPFATLEQNFMVIPSSSTKLLNLNQDHPLQKLFWSNSYKIDVMITSLIEILVLLNLGHMTTPKIQFESRDEILLVTS